MAIMAGTVTVTTIRRITAAIMGTDTGRGSRITAVTVTRTMDTTVTGATAITTIVITTIAITTTTATATEAIIMAAFISRLASSVQPAKRLFTKAAAASARSARGCRFAFGRH
jgi:TRAP-type C4-dicarboxylate transport system permease large subunit